jgi:hypothetical protein
MRYKKTGEGNRTPVISFFKDMVLPLNYAYSRGYGVDGLFLSKKIKLEEQTSPQIKPQHHTHHSLFIKVSQLSVLRKIKYFLFLV